MTAAFDEDALRDWLVDYLVANIGCNPDEIDLDSSMHDLGLGSGDAVVLTGELSELLGRQVSPVEFWQYPTINALVKFLTGSPSEVEVVDSCGGSYLGEPVAVVGLGCRFPGGVGGPESLWRFVCEGRSSVGRLPADRWALFDDGSPEVGAALAATTRWGSFLSDVDAFDAEFFEISPREAAKMDPQQRLVLEVAYEALEHAGIAAPSLRQSLTGVFVGACLGEYGYLASADLSQVDAWSGTGGALSVIANRVSYFLDLRGPSVTVDTACSSSLVAVHLACQSLRTGDADLALAAGVNVVLSPAVTRSFDLANAMSPSGCCHAFDAAADGFVRGEGCGVAVLKRLSDARRDGDRVLAVVRGSAVNQDGRSNGLMAPNPAAQMAVLRAAYANAGLAPGEVDYVEAHGTGTLLGDPIEARALGTVLGRGRPPTNPLLIGAIKTNLGHLEAAAGIAGFCKAVLAVHSAHIPANACFDSPNPHIPFGDLRLRVVDAPMDWPVTGRPRRAGVSSFGFGGTNAHVVLEQAPVVEPAAGVPAPAVTTLVVSGKTTQRLEAMAAVLADWMEHDQPGVELADIAHTLNHHRTRHPLFATVCARNRTQAITALRELAAGRTTAGVVRAQHLPADARTVFVYPGSNSQWAGMGRQLLADEPAFAAAIADLEPIFVAQTGFSLQRALTSGESPSGERGVQPVTMAVQLALTALWRSYGVEPDAVIGHSMGEVSAAVVAGALSPAEGLYVITTRSRLMARLAGQGAMALLETDTHATEQLIADYPDVTIAVHASPRQTAIAGPPHQINALIAQVQQKALPVRRIDTQIAANTVLMDPISDELASALSALTPKSPKIPYLSTVATADSAVVLDAAHWVANLRHPLRLDQAIAAAARNHSTFIEISPHPEVADPIAAILESEPWSGCFALHTRTARVDDETLYFHSQLAALGVTPQANAAGRLVDIPPTPWLHSRYWVPNRSVRAGVTAAHPLLGTHVEMPSGREHVWQVRAHTERNPWLMNHAVHGQPVMPLAAFAEMVVAAGSAALGLPVGDVEVNRLETEQILALDGRTELTTQLVRDADDAVRVEIHSRSTGGRWCRHVVARVGVTRHGIPPQDCNTLSDVGTVVAPTDFYAARGRAGIQQGPPFTALTRIVRTPGETVHAEIVLPEEAGSTQGYGIHPVMLEAALQSLVAATPVEPLPVEVTYLPMSLGSIRLSGVMGRRARCRAESVSANDDGADLWGHVSVIDDAGTAIAEVRDVRLRRVERSMVPSTLDRATGDDAHRSGPSSDWSSMTAEEVCAELQAGLQAILARELQAPQTTLDINQPFPEMGLDSMMAMAVLREAQHLVGIDLSATMLWDHPTISSLARHLAESLAPELNTEHDDVDLDGSTSSSVLDALFDSVESEHFPSESGIR